MVRNIKIVGAYANEEATQPDDQVQEQASENANTQEPEVAVFETTPDTEALTEDAAAGGAAVEEPSPKPTPTSK